MQSVFFEYLLYRAEQFGDVATAKEVFSHKAFEDISAYYLEKLQRAYPEAYANVAVKESARSVVGWEPVYKKQPTNVATTAAVSYISKLKQEEIAAASAPIDPDLALKVFESMINSAYSLLQCGIDRKLKIGQDVHVTPDGADLVGTWLNFVWRFKPSWRVVYPNGDEC